MWPRIEPRSPGPLANIMFWLKNLCFANYEVFYNGYENIYLHAI